MPTWKEPYKIRRSNRILSYAVKQNNTLLEIAGEPVFLLKRFASANAPFQKNTRKVSTLTENTSAYSYTVDPDTGALRYLLWSEDSDKNTEYPDITTFTCTVEASGGTSVWAPSVDKYSMIADAEEYSFDIFQDQIDSDGNDISDAIYVVFNTPPFTSANTVYTSFGNINLLVNFSGMQPVRDNETNFQNSLFGFEQWTNPLKKVRKRGAPNAFLLAFPGVRSDFTITEGGLLRETQADFWTVPPPYSPAVVEHDVIVRQLTGQRFQVINYTPIYIENILVSQHFDMVELDPRSSIYDIEYDAGYE